MGETELFERLYGELSKDVYSYHSLCAGAENAADLTQQTFLNLWRHIKGSGAGEENPRAIVFRIAVNVKNDFLRRKLRRPPALEFCEELDGELSDDCDITDAQAVRAAFAALREDRREILTLRNIGLDSAEAGRALGISASAARSRLAAARADFKEKLRECGVTADKYE